MYFSRQVGKVLREKGKTHEDKSFKTVSFDFSVHNTNYCTCLLYTSDAADD